MVSRKIVAIGGGKNGRIKSDGTKEDYETIEIDSEIIKLTGKRNPNFLFLGHAQLEESNEIGYFNTMKSIYGEVFKCECKILKRSELKTDIEKVQKYVDWADIIYEGGGDTKGMIELWNKTGFDAILKNAWIQGKVMCGVSAGANCWFKSCSSDSLKIQLKDDNAPLINVECLNFVNVFFTPHCDAKDEHTNRLEHMKESLKVSNLIGLGMSNCCAIEIIDDKYRLVISKKDAYGIKAYWDNEQYKEEYIEVSKEFKNLGKLLAK